MVAKVGPDLVVLRAPMPLTSGADAAEVEFEVRKGDRLAFVMSYGPSHQPAPPAIDAEVALIETGEYWRNWIYHFDDSKTDWPQSVRRSLLTLKALIHQQSGGLIAAPTTSLPGAPGGRMNWDYRYCWLRDASFTFGALLNAGFLGEAQAWRDWLLRAIAGSPDRIRIMYRVDGSRHLAEWDRRYAARISIFEAGASGQRRVDATSNRCSRRGNRLPRSCPAWRCAYLKP